MAFSGYLIKVGGSLGTELPMKYIKIEGYNITSNQRMETEAKRDLTGSLHRSTVAHTATKVEFTTPNITNDDVDAMMTLFRNAWSNTTERKLTLEYYDPETNAYKTGDFYMPDIKYEMYSVDTVNNIIRYKEIRVAFIEY